MTVPQEVVNFAKQSRELVTRRAALAAAIDKLSKDQATQLAARRSAETICADCEKQLTTVMGTSRASASRELAAARQELKRANEAIEALDVPLLDLTAKASDCDDGIEALGNQIAKFSAAFQLALDTELQREFDAVVPALVRALSRGFAFRAATQWYRQLEDALLPSIDLFSSPLIQNGRQRIGAPSDKRYVVLEKAWRDDAHLVAESDEIREVFFALKAMVETAAAVESARRKDPAHRERFLGQDRARAAAGAEEDRQSREAERLRKAEEDARREEYAARTYAERCGTDVRMPGTPAPGQTREQFDAELREREREAADARSRRVAADEKAEEALHRKIRPVDGEPAAA